MIALCSIFLSLLTIIFVKGCTLEGCEYQDAGSCGSACCRLSISILNETTTDVMNKLNNSITSGGPDFLYTPMMTAEGTLTFGDLRPYHPGEVDFIGQTVHTTINGLYNDTVNFLLKEASYGTEVYAFSISQTAGAYGDEGQNYFNILQLFQSIPWHYKMKHVDDSCTNYVPIEK